jgi:hypothetical protein
VVLKRVIGEELEHIQHVLFIILGFWIGSFACYQSIEVLSLALDMEACERAFIAWIRFLRCNFTIYLFNEFFKSYNLSSFCFKMLHSFSFYSHYFLWWFQINVNFTTFDITHGTHRISISFFTLISAHLKYVLIDFKLVIIFLFPS